MLALDVKSYGVPHVIPILQVVFIVLHISVSKHVENNPPMRIISRIPELMEGFPPFPEHSEGP